jgi:Tfp pilus assembly protein FimV
MQKDFKIGLFAGMVLVSAAVVWLCTLPRFSTKSRAVQMISNKPPPPVVQQTIPAQSSVEENNGLQTTTPEKPLRIHVVQKGETLSSIAQKYYGSHRSWQKILNANRDKLPDPNRLVPGSRLIIPE